MHLGNIVLYASADGAGVQAFDFGAAFNFSVGGGNEHVSFDRKIRGAVLGEWCNHFRSFPAEWTTKSKEFWSEVVQMRDFSNSMWDSILKYLKLYYTDEV